MSSPLASRILEELVDSIDIPDSAYKKADARYRDLAEWFSRAQSRCMPFSPHVYPQGSFRLGTVVRPISSKGEYDLDVGCRLRVGLSKQTHTQQSLKQLVGSEVAEYRRARNIADPPLEMRRCWRLAYADDLSFHMDIVPSIPENAIRRAILKDAVRAAGASEELARGIADLTGAITDNERVDYAIISDDWRVSNSEGYALWFESRMKLAHELMLERAKAARVGRIDELPATRWKSPLQAAVQVLKRHRDIMFAGRPERQPISVIITTLAAQAYRGEPSFADALEQILRSMDAFVGAVTPRIPNPVNPSEDFADKWADSKHRHLDLEGNFRRWLSQARKDFQVLGAARDRGQVIEHVEKSFGSRLGVSGGASLLAPAVAPSLGFPPKPITPSKPAGFA